MNAPGRVQLYDQAWNAPLLDTTAARVIVFRDRFDEPHTVIYRILTDDTWAMVTRDQPDWALKIAELRIT